MLYKTFIILSLLLWPITANAQQNPEDLVPLLWEAPVTSSRDVSQATDRPAKIARFKRVKPKKFNTKVQQFNKRVTKRSRTKQFNKRVPQVQRARQFNKRVPEVRDAREHGKNSIRYKRPPQRNPKFVTYPPAQ